MKFLRFNMSNNKLGTVLDGLFATSNIDSSGEIIDIEGVDISTLDIDGLANWEHKGDSPNQIVGKVLYCKKLFNKEDCRNDRERYFWDKVEVPCIYGKIVLFDDVGHEGSKSIVAMLKFDQKLDKTDTRQVMGFSIEGSRLGKDGSKITKCIARRIAISNFPCNKTCIAEMLEDDKPIEITAKQLLAAFKKSEEINNDLSKAEYNNKLAFKLTPKPKKINTYKPITTATGEHREGTAIKPLSIVKPAESPEKQKVGQRVDYKAGKTKARTGRQIYNDPETWKSETNSVRKEILKSMSNQNIQNRMMLSERKEEMRKDILKSMADDAFEHFEKKEELVAFVGGKYPEMSEIEVLAFAKTFAFVQMKKSEMDMVKMAGEIDSDLSKAASDKKVSNFMGDARHKGDMVHHSKLNDKQKAQAKGMFPHQTPVSEHVGHNKPIAHENYHYQVDKKGNVAGRRHLSNVGLHEGKLKNLKEMKTPNLPKSEQDMVKADDSYGYSEKNPKIDIHVNGKYHKSTNWAKNLKQAKEKHLERNPEHKPEDVKAHYSKPKVKK